MGGLVLVLAVLATLADVPAALAHASLIRSEPADRAVMAHSPAALALTFNEPVSPLQMRLLDSSGRTIELADVVAADATLTIRLADPLPRGTHLLSWRAASADGHPVGGALTFSVGTPSAQAPAIADAGGPLQPAIWAVKLAMYAGLFGGIGGAFYAGWIAAEPLPRRTRRLIGAALELGLIATIISLGLQGLDALGLPLADLKQPRIWAQGFATSYGATAAITAAALVLAHIALSARARYRRWLSAFAVVGVGAALVASGHASSAAPQLLTRAMVFLHGVSLAFWIGALLPLIDAVLRGRRDELARFSRVIPVPLAVLIGSGVTLAAIQLREPDALWTTAYGVVLSAKLVAVAALLAIAIVNRRRTPSALQGDERAKRNLATSIVAELAIIIVIFGLVASWRFTPPPRILIVAGEAPVHVHIHAEQAMADVTVERLRDGSRQITLVLLDGAFGPLAAKEVTLLLSKPDAGIERLRLPATHVEETIWRIDGVRIPGTGRWHARVEILINDFEKVGIEDEIELQR